MTSRPSLYPYLRLRQFKCSSISPILDVVRCLVISRFLLIDLYESQTELASSSDGLLYRPVQQITDKVSKLATDANYTQLSSLLLNWSHHKKKSMVVIAIWLTITKYPYLKWQRILHFYSRFFSFVYHYQNFYRTWLYTWVTRRMYYKKQDLLTIWEYLSSPLVFSGIRVAHIISILCCPIV